MQTTAAPVQPAVPNPPTHMNVHGASGAAHVEEIAQQLVSLAPA